MVKITATSAIKLKVPLALTKAEFESYVVNNFKHKAITRHMSKNTISKLRLAYEKALNANLCKFNFQGNTWLTRFAKTSFMELEEKNWRTFSPRTF
jgi:hypothetical protein